MAHGQLVWRTPQGSLPHSEGDYTITSDTSAKLPSVGLGQICEASLYVYPSDAMAPRRPQITEELLSYANNWRLGFNRNIIEISDTPEDTIDNGEFQEAEQVRVAVSAPWNPNAAAGDPWEARRPEIEKLYKKETLPEVVRIMTERGFEKPEHSYKKRFKKWGLKKYDTVKNYAPPGNRPIISQSHAGEHVRGSRSTSTSAQHEEDLIQRNSHRSGGAVVKWTNSAVRMPMHIRPVEWQGQFTFILSQVENLYLGSMKRERWQVKDPLLVQEDQHDDLLVLVGTALKNFDSQENDIAWAVLRKAFVTLDKVVADRGVFSLPMIWESSRRMIRKGHHALASKFLAHAWKFARTKARDRPRDPFVLVLAGLCEVEKTHPEMLEDVILKAYGSCIQHVLQKLTSNNLTALTLWSDFVVYMDNRGAREVSQAADHLQTEIQQSGLDNDMDDDKILEVRGLSLYVLQTTPETAGEAEGVALDMLCRVNRRLQKGEKLEGGLRILWKDLKHTLGNFCYHKGELPAAIAHMRECLTYGIEDDRDVLTLKSLEEWHTELGELDEAERVRNVRLEFSQRG